MRTQCCCPGSAAPRPAPGAHLARTCLSPAPLPPCPPPLHGRPLPPGACFLLARKFKPESTQQLLDIASEWVSWRG